MTSAICQGGIRGTVFGTLLISTCADVDKYRCPRFSVLPRSWRRHQVSSWIHTRKKTPHRNRAGQVSGLSRPASAWMSRGDHNVTMSTIGISLCDVRAACAKHTSSTTGLGFICPAEAPRRQYRHATAERMQAPYHLHASYMLLESRCGRHRNHCGSM